MAQTPKQKQQQSKRRLEKRADHIVGKFLNSWNLFEGHIAEALTQICDLKSLGGAIITANLNFQSKMAITISMIDLYSKGQSKEWKEKARKTFNRAFEINTDWRNVVAHNVFIPNTDRTIKVLRVQAKRELKIPDIQKTKRDFDLVGFELRHLGDEIRRLANIAHKSKREIERERLKQPTLSLAQLGAGYPQQSPLAMLLNSPPPNLALFGQTPLVLREAAAERKK